MTVGALIRVFFILRVLERDKTQEVEAPPFPVFKGTYLFPIVGVRKVDSAMFYIVSKEEDLWWLNPFVPNPLSYLGSLNVLLESFDTCMR